MTLQDFNNSVNEAREHLRASDVPIYKKPNYVLEFLFTGGMFAIVYIIYLVVN